MRDSTHPEDRRRTHADRKTTADRRRRGWPRRSLFPATALAGELPARRATPARARRTRRSGGTLKVCKKGCKYKKIQKAIDAAGKGTTIRVGEGTYKEGLKILSPTKDRSS